MRRHALIILLVAIIITSGCLGGKDTTGSSPAIEETKVTPSTTTTTTMETTTTQTSSPLQRPGETREKLLQEVSGMERYTYTANTTISMIVVVTEENLSQRDNVTLRIIEEGYLDLESGDAWINTTTTSVPDGASTNTSRIVVGNVTYLLTPAGWVKEDPNASRLLWEYNIVSLARRYLKKEPDERETGERLLLRYVLGGDEIEPLGRAYFAMTPDTEVEVRDGLLELYFEGGKLAGGRISFRIRTVTSINDPNLGSMTITQDGSWSQTVRITSVNERRKVEAPASSP
ncbi:hypothetical protein A3L12_04615 [Thermococcus sp. P6]|uniref:hypothetical protein n=1 Tax=Thermococcus sp. P6 TaxID=122420 RepID=UPI000B5A041D|nr:hypothetical protein [Thermococcus sp. P6]ASJ10630.1 hypothetical protein A3L12_04615 [Thermococcus sp. P6]